MAQRYKGTINKVNGSSTFGYIKLSTVTDQYGERVQLDTNKDIYIHEDECSGRIYAGMDVNFQLATDTKRERAFRATDVRTDYTPPVKGGIELHFDEQAIDHPMVPVRWCISSEILAMMREDDGKLWALLIVAQERSNDASTRYYGSRKTVVKAVIGLKDIGIGRGFFLFRASGDYDFVAYLIEARDEPWLKRSLKEVIDNPDRYGSVRDKTGAIASYCDSISPLRRSDWIAGIYHCQVSVPSEIFAKPLSDGMKVYLAYFRLNKPRDECATRGRLFFAFTIGLVLYLGIELIKRSWILVVSLLHFLVGGNPLPFLGAAFAGQISAHVSGLFAEDDYKPMLNYGGWRFFLRPGVVLVPALLITLCVMVPWIRDALFFVGGGLLAICALIGCLWGWSAVSRWLEQRNEANDRAKALVRVETYAVCGREGTDPKGPVTVSLVWNGMKRMVCRNYGS